MAATALRWLKHSSFQVTVYLTEMQAALLIFCLFPRCEMRWWKQFSCSAIRYRLSSSAMSCVLLANTTTGHWQLQSVLEKCFQSSALSHCKSPQVHSSHLWKWGLFFLAHQHLTETDTLKNMKFIPCRRLSTLSTLGQLAKMINISNFCHICFWIYINTSYHQSVGTHF